MHFSNFNSTWKLNSNIKLKVRQPGRLSILLWTGKQTNPLTVKLYLHRETEREFTVMDWLFILGHICIYKGLSAHICVFTRHILWPNENKSIVPLGIGRPSDAQPQQSINILLHPASVHANTLAASMLRVAQFPRLALNPNLYSKHLGTSEQGPCAEWTLITGLSFCQQN